MLGARDAGSCAFARSVVVGVHRHAAGTGCPHLEGGPQGRLFTTVQRQATSAKPKRVHQDPPNSTDLQEAGTLRPLNATVFIRSMMESLTTVTFSSEAPILYAIANGSLTFN